MQAFIVDPMCHHKSHILSSLTPHSPHPCFCTSCSAPPPIPTPHPGPCPAPELLLLEPSARLLPKPDLLPRESAPQTTAAAASGAGVRALAGSGGRRGGLQPKWRLCHCQSHSSDFTAEPPFWSQSPPPRGKFKCGPWGSGHGSSSGFQQAPNNSSGLCWADVVRPSSPEPAPAIHLPLSSTFSRSILDPTFTSTRRSHHGRGPLGCLRAPAIARVARV